MSANGYDVSLHWINRELQHLGLCIDNWRANTRRGQVTDGTALDRCKAELARIKLEATKKVKDAKLRADALTATALRSVKQTLSIKARRSTVAVPSCVY